MTFSDRTLRSAIDLIGIVADSHVERPLLGRFLMQPVHVVLELLEQIDSNLDMLPLDHEATSLVP